MRLGVNRGTQTTSNVFARRPAPTARTPVTAEELGVDDVEEVARREAIGRVDDVGLAPADELLADVDGERAAR